MRRLRPEQNAKRRAATVQRRADNRRRCAYLNCGRLISENARCVQSKFCQTECQVAATIMGRRLAKPFVTEVSPCVFCGDPFIPARRNVSTCGIDCKDALRKRTKAGTPVYFHLFPKRCEYFNCQKWIKRDRHNGRFCVGEECGRLERLMESKIENHLEEVLTPCEICSTPFFASHKDMRWCHADCRAQRTYDLDPALIRYYAAFRRARIKQATPAWADNDAIKMLYLNCPDGLEVDHHYPLQGETVSGLHVAINMRYLTRNHNARKKNKHPDDWMAELEAA